MKKHFPLPIALISVVLSAALLNGLASCTLRKNNNMTGDPQISREYTPEERESLRDPSYSSSPFFDIAEGTDYPDEKEIKAKLSSIPTGRYETSPGLHNVPLTTTLYKNGKTTTIDLQDDRLIRLMNLYNNSVCYHKYAYTQGLLNREAIEKAESEEPRLVLTFSTESRGEKIVYDTNVLTHDTIIVTNEWFVLIAHDLKGYEGEENEYPFHAVGHLPLYENHNWLDLSGF